MTDLVQIIDEIHKAPRAAGSYFPGAYPSSIYGNAVTAFYGNPRTILLSLKYRY